jgi:hypothetical protein
MQYNMQKQNNFILWSSFPSSVFNGLDKMQETLFIWANGWKIEKCVKLKKMQNVGISIVYIACIALF